MGTLLFLGIAGEGPPADDRADQLLLFDFDKAPLADNWTSGGRGRIQAVRQRLPGIDGEQPATPALVPTDYGVTIRSAGQSGLFCRSNMIPQDWTGFETLHFWVYREPQSPEQAVSTLEIRLFESDGKARFWRKVEVAHDGWKELSVPLRWFRWGAGRIPSWQRIDRLGVWFREPAELSVDTIWVTRAEQPRNDFLSAKTIIPVAFGESPDNVAQLERQPEVEILTNVPDLDLDSLGESLAKTVRQFRQDFPHLAQHGPPPLLVVFADRTQYQQFVLRLGQQLNSVAPPPVSDGYSLHGVSLSYWDEQQGTHRPVYTHELIHGLLARSLRVRSRGGWWHEGLATMYQLRAHPQDNLVEIISEGIQQDRFRMPLDRLCTGERIPNNRYWQASTIVEMLLVSLKYQAKLQELTAAFQQQGSTNLQPHLESILNTDWQGLTEDWISYCQQRYLAD